MRRLSDKLAHIDAALDGLSEVAGRDRAGALTLADLRLEPTALPECDLDAIDASLELVGKRVSAPIMISPMTGGLARGGDLNRRMARAAEAVGLAFGVGSQRVALEKPERARDFQLRDVAPTIPLFANLGAVQLVKGYDASDARRAVEMIEADALFLHLNPVQELVQEGGDVAWTGVLRAIEAVCSELSRERVPVFAREVGFGLGARDAGRLRDAGVAGLDCAGGGGTSWSRVEGRVASGDRARRLGEVFADWGLTTPEAVLAVRSEVRDLPLIASGGVRSGLDAMKLVALGATVAGMASPILRAAADSEEACLAYVEQVVLEAKATMFACGAATIDAFRRQVRFVQPAALPRAP